MNDSAIKIEGLGKRYRYGAAQSVSSNLRADLTDWVRGVFRRGDRRPEPEAGSLQSSGFSLPRSHPASVIRLQSPVMRLTLLKVFSHQSSVCRKRQRRLVRLGFSLFRSHPASVIRLQSRIMRMIRPIFGRSRI